MWAQHTYWHSNSSEPALDNTVPIICASQLWEPAPDTTVPSISTLVADLYYLDDENLTPALTCCVPGS